MSEMHCKRLSVLANKGFSPKVIYDIGACRGDWSESVQTVFPKSHFYLFEASETNRKILSQKKFPYFIELLGDKEESHVVFYQGSSTRGCESIFPELADKRIEKIYKMTTLSSIVEKNNLPFPDLVKLDVQGAENLIINGSPSLICHAEVVILETKILKYDPNIPVVHESISLMMSFGFSLSDILGWTYFSSGELNEMDLLFIKSGSKYRKVGPFT